MSQAKIKTQDYDPFRFMSLYRGLRDRHSGWLGIIGAVLLALLLLSTAVDGTLGTVHDVQLWADIRRPLGIDVQPPSEPYFPLMRDISSWFLALATVLGVVLLHRQWQYMSTCLSELARNGAIVPKRQPRSNMFSRLLLIDRMIRGVPPDKALDTIVGKIVGGLARRSRFVFATLALLSIVLAILLQLGQANGLFATIAPPGMSAGARHQWLTQAYQSWWASERHPFGHVVYTVFAIFAILVIGHFEVVGLVAVYLTIAMSFVVDLHADWLNTDGRFGWSPIARIYRTVMWSNTLLGTTLAVVLVSIGINNYVWVAALVIGYVLFMPLFTLVPRTTFRKVEQRARSVRIAAIKEVIQRNGISVDTDIDKIGPYLAEIDRCRSAKIRPLRMSTFSFSTYVIVVILPVGLAAAQVFLQLRSPGK